MPPKRNNKGKAAGSGTVSNVRKERYRKACAERTGLWPLLLPKMKGTKPTLSKRYGERMGHLPNRWKKRRMRRWKKKRRKERRRGKRGCTLPKGAASKGKRKGKGGCTLPKGAEEELGGSGKGSFLSKGEWGGILIICTLPKGAEEWWGGILISCTLPKGAASSIISCNSLPKGEKVNHKGLFEPSQFPKPRGQKEGALSKGCWSKPCQVQLHGQACVQEPEMDPGWPQMGDACHRLAQHFGREGQPGQEQRCGSPEEAERQGVLLDPPVTAESWGNHGFHAPPGFAQVLWQGEVYLEKEWYPWQAAVLQWQPHPPFVWWLWRGGCRVCWERVSIYLQLEHPTLSAHCGALVLL